MATTPRIMLGLILAFALGCRPNSPGTLTDAERTSVLQAVRPVLDSSFAAWVRGDLAGFMRYYAPGPEATFSGEGTIFAGHDSIASALRTAMSSWRGIDSASMQNVRIVVLGPDAAVVTANFRERVTETTGAQYWSVGASTDALGVRNGEWKIVASHFSHPRVTR